MNDSPEPSDPGGDRRRRSRRIVAAFVVATLAFAAAVGVSRYMEMAALRPAETGAERGTQP